MLIALRCIIYMCYTAFILIEQYRLVSSRRYSDAGEGESPGG